MVRTNDPEILEPMLPKVLTRFLNEFSTKSLDFNLLSEFADASAGKKVADLKMKPAQELDLRDSCIQKVFEQLSRKVEFVQSVNMENKSRK